MSNNPDDVVAGTQKPCFGFVYERKLLVFEELADFLFSVHAQRVKPVAFTPFAKCKRPTDFFFVDKDTILVGTKMGCNPLEGEFYRNINVSRIFGNLENLIFGTRIAPRQNQGFAVFEQLKTCRHYAFAGLRAQKPINIVPCGKAKFVEPLV